MITAYIQHIFLMYFPRDWSVYLLPRFYSGKEYFLSKLFLMFPKIWDQNKIQELLTNLSKEENSGYQLYYLHLYLSLGIAFFNDHRASYLDDMLQLCALLLRYSQCWDSSMPYHARSVNHLYLFLMRLSFDWYIWRLIPVKDLWDVFNLHY